MSRAGSYIYESLVDEEINEEDMVESEDCIYIKNGTNPKVPPGRRTCEFVLEKDNTVKLVAYYGNNESKQECMCVPATVEGEIDFSVLGKTFGIFTNKHKFTSIVVEDDRINRWIAEELFGL